MEKLDIFNFIQDYSRSSKRIILLDYDGTLVPIMPLPNQSAPDIIIKEILLKLASDTANEVIVISGRPKQDLDQWISDLNITLVAEHGGFVKRPSSDWQPFFSAPVNWKMAFMPLLQALVTNYPGSFLEEKYFSISWHYRQVAERVQISKDQILMSFRALPFFPDCHMVDEDCTLEFRTPSVGKGKFLSHWLTTFAYFDFVVAIGDGQTDEDMFKLLPKPYYAIRIGENYASSATYYLDHQSDVIAVLNELTKYSAS
jgi:trehalose 6-phosphate synthase/phosphatase